MAASKSYTIKLEYLAVGFEQATAKFKNLSELVGITGATVVGFSDKVDVATETVRRSVEVQADSFKDLQNAMRQLEQVNEAVFESMVKTEREAFEKRELLRVEEARREAARQHTLSQGGILVPNLSKQMEIKPETFNEEKYRKEFAATQKIHIALLEKTKQEEAEAQRKSILTSKELLEERRQVLDEYDAWEKKNQDDRLATHKAFLKAEIDAEKQSEQLTKQLQQALAADYREATNKTSTILNEQISNLDKNLKQQQALRVGANKTLIEEQQRVAAKELEIRKNLQQQLLTYGAELDATRISEKQFNYNIKRSTEAAERKINKLRDDLKSFSDYQKQLEQDDFNSHVALFKKQQDLLLQAGDHDAQVKSYKEYLRQQERELQSHNERMTKLYSDFENTQNQNIFNKRKENFKEALSLENKLLKESIDYQIAEQVHGSQSLIALKLKEAQELRVIAEKLAEQQKEIQQRYLSGSINTPEMKQELDYASLRAEQDSLQAKQAVIAYNFKKEIDEKAIKDAQEYSKRKLDANLQVSKAIQDNQNKIIKEEQTAFKQANIESLAELDRKIALEKSKIVNGEKDKKTIWLAAANEELRIKQKLKADLKAVEDSIGTTHTAMSAATEKTRLLNTATKELQATIKDLPKDNAHLTNSFTNMLKHIGEVYVMWGLLNAVSTRFREAIYSIIPAGIALDSVQSSLEATLSSTTRSAGAMKALTQEAKRTGIEITTLRTTFASFQASTSLAGASLGDTWKMFQNINTVSTALHKTTDETNHIFLAMSQIFNKSKVQSEELVKQLGNLLPGAFASFAASYKNSNGTIGISTGELTRRMKEGLVDAKSTMLDFTQFYADKFAGSFVSASTKLNAEIGRMKTEFQKLAEALYNTSNGAIKEFVKGLTGVVESVRIFIEDGKSVNTLLYAMKDIFIAVANVGAVLLGAKLAAMIPTFKTLRLEGELLSKSMAIFTNPTAIVGGLSLIAQGLADMSHAAREGQVNVAEFLNELDKKRHRQEAPKAIQIELDIDADPTVEKLRKQLLSLKEQFKDPVKFFSNKDFDEITKQVESLKAGGAKIRSISPDVRMFGLPDNQAKAIIIAEIQKTEKEYRIARQNAKEQANTAIKEEEKRAAETLYGNDARKALEQSTVTEMKAWMAERNMERAKANNNMLDAEKAANEKAALMAQSRKEKMQEVFKEELSIMEKRQQIIDERKKAGTFGSIPQDTEAEAELAKQRQDYEIKRKGEEAKIEIENMKDLASIKQEYARQNKVDYKDAERDAKNLALQMEANLTNLESAFKEGKYSIASYVAEWLRLKKVQNEKVGAGLEENANKAFAAGDTTNFEKFRDQLQTLAMEGGNLEAEANKKKTELLVAYNSNLQEIHAEYLQLNGEEGQSDVEKFNLRYNLVEKEIEEQAKLGEASSLQAQAEVKSIRELLAVKQQIKSINKIIDTEQLSLQERERRLNLDLKSGAIDKFVFAQKLFEERQKTIALIDEQLTKESLLKLNDEERLKLERQRKELQQLNTDKIGSANSIINRGNSGPLGGISTSVTQFREDRGNLVMGKQQEYAAADDSLKADKENYAKMGLAKQDYDAKVTEAYQANIDKKKTADRNYTLGTIKSYTDMFTGIFSSGASTYQALTDMNVKMYGANSKEAKKSFNMWKQMKIAETISSTASGAINAYSAMAAIPYVGPFLGAAAAAIVVAYGAKQISDISSQQLPAAHGGLDYVPKETTYQLDKGERVISPRQNVELTKAVTNINSGSGSVSKNSLTNQDIKVRIVNVGSEDDIFSALNSPTGERIIMNHYRRNQAA